MSSFKAFQWIVENFLEFQNGTVVLPVCQFEKIKEHAAIINVSYNKDSQARSDEIDALGC